MKTINLFLLLSLIYTHSLTAQSFEGITLLDKYRIEDLEKKFATTAIKVEKVEAIYEIEIPLSTTDATQFIHLELANYDELDGGTLKRYWLNNTTKERAFLCYDQVKAQHGRPDVGYEKRCNYNYTDHHDHPIYYVNDVAYFNKLIKGDVLRVTVRPMSDQNGTYRFDVDYQAEKPVLYQSPSDFNPATEKDCQALQTF